MLADLVATWIVAAAAVVALVVTALVQVHDFQPGRWLKARDAFALIPAWTFFAPNPGTTDTRLLWRERYGGGSVSPWHEALPPRTGLLRAIWNPDKRVRKAITDVGPMVARRAAERPDDRRLLISVPFLMLLHFVTSQAANPLAEAVQFVVVQTTGRDGSPEPPRILVVSNWHRLDEEIAADVGTQREQSIAAREGAGEQPASGPPHSSPEPVGASRLR